jgi:DNA processing protein
MSTLFSHISKINLQDADFPDRLKEISSPPNALYVVGTLPKDKHYVAIVGTRKPTAYGEHVTYLFARELAKAGVVIVSGLAYGVDSIAHRAALDVGGLTVAVLAQSLTRIYPREHTALAQEIVTSGGAIVSEYEPGHPTFRSNFVARNRLVAGLCEITIVTEAGITSGTLHTANFAAKENRTVMAIPGPITAAGSATPNNLLRVGATPAVSPSDVIEALGYKTPASVPVAPRNAEEATILQLLKSGSTTSDEIIEASGLTAAQFANTISLMEITGKVRNLGAGQWVAR